MKKTVLQLKDEINQLIEKNKGLVSKAREEKRSLTTDEDREFGDRVLQIRELDLEVDLQQRSQSFTPGKLVTQQAVPGGQSQFSLMKAIRTVINGGTFSELEQRVFQAGRQEMLEANQQVSGSIIIPTEIRADILAGTATQGQEIVQEQKVAIMAPLQNKLVLTQAGATFYTGLKGTMSVPSYSGTTVLWKGEVESAVDGAGLFDEIEFSPLRLTAYIDVSKLWLMMDNVGAERMLYDNIIGAVARKLESTILGVGARTATMPQGAGYKCTSGTDTKIAKATPTNANIVGLETAVAMANADIKNLAYITNSHGRGILKTTLKEAGLPGYLCNDQNQVNGYPLYVSNGCSSLAGTDAGDLIIFGNWAALGIAQWGGYEVTVDNLTLAKDNKVRIVINAFFDAKGLYGSSATDVHGASTSDADEYAVAFSSLAIK